MHLRIIFQTDCATCFNSVVLPAFGGDTIIPRCPFPIWRQQVYNPHRRTALSVLQRRSLSFGKIGVISSKFALFVASLGETPLIFVRYKRALRFFCLCLNPCISGDNIFQVFKPNTADLRQGKHTHHSLPEDNYRLRINPYPSGSTSINCVCHHASCQSCSISATPAFSFLISSFTSFALSFSVLFQHQFYQL